MSRISTNISIDPEIKARAQVLFADLGLDLSTAINMFLRQSIRVDGLPFEVTRRTPNEKTLKAISDAEDGIDMEGPFDSVKDLMEALDA